MANSEDGQSDEGVAAHTSGQRSQARDHHVMDNDGEHIPWYRDSQLVDPPFQLVKCFKVRKALYFAHHCLATYSFDLRTFVARLTASYLYSRGTSALCSLSGSYTPITYLASGLNSSKRIPG